jgi:hypothetical protein
LSQALRPLVPDPRLPGQADAVIERSTFIGAIPSLVGVVDGYRPSP